jgi:hypothetical protein
MNYLEKSELDPTITWKSGFFMLIKILLMI